MDAVDNKPPIMYGFFYAVYFFAGVGNLPMVHAVTTLIVMATSLLVYSTARIFTDFRNAFIALLFFIFITHIHEPKYISTNGETLLNFLVMGSVYCYLLNRNARFSFLRAVTAGAFLGIAVLTSYKAGILALVMAAEVILTPLFLSPSEKASYMPAKKYTNLLITGIFSIIPILLILIYFYYRGNLTEFLYWGFTYNFEYISSGEKTFSLLRSIGRSFIFLGMTAPLVIIVLSSLKLRHKKILRSIPDKQYFIFIIIWLILSCGAVLQGEDATPITIFSLLHHWHYWRLLYTI